MFGIFKNKTGDLAAKLDGSRLDLLEAGGAIGALVSAADGDVGESELKATVKAIKANEVVARVFSAGDIEKQVEKAFDKADGGTFSGKRALWNEIKEVLDKERDGDAEILLMIGADVAASEGDIGEKEREVLAKLATMGRLKLEEYGI